MRGIARQTRLASARCVLHSRFVSRSTSKLALAAGFFVVLALAIGLVRLTRSAPPKSMGGSGSEAPTPEPAVAAPAAPPVRPIEAREERPAPAAPRRSVGAPSKQPELAPAPVGFDRELKRDANGHLVPMIPVSELRAQLDRTDAAMKACLERAGPQATGKATLAFTVAAKNSKLVIESTTTLDEETLGGYPELLECMHRTAKLFALDGHPVPELGTAIYVRRHVRVENGTLAENSIFNFSYNP
jgi:hypothetical protein